jgi:murein DD-endopeptidase MepM/ murein hydrolase activator NlpD
LKPAYLGPSFTALSFLFFTLACAPSVIIAPALKSPGVYHVVKSGETLSGIGKTYGVSYQELARVNRLADPNQIRPGQRIFVPGAAQPLPVEVGMALDTSVDPSRDLSQSTERPERQSYNGFVWPVNGTVNSVFGPRGASFHDGIDIAAPEGTLILALERGEVIYSDHLRGYGNMVIIRHADGFASIYAHNQMNLVREGQVVAKGEVIGKVGSTGRVSGPHLHLEIRKDNVAQDPLRYLPPLCCSTPLDIVSPGD